MKGNEAKASNERTYKNIFILETESKRKYDEGETNESKASEENTKRRKSNSHDG